MSEKSVKRNLSVVGEKSNQGNQQKSGGPQLVGVYPKELCQEMGQAFNAFIEMNGQPNEQGVISGVKGKIARKMHYNRKSIELNVKDYAKKEDAYIKANVEHNEAGERLFWNGTDIEDVYEETPVVVDGLPTPEVDRKLIGGLMTQKTIKEIPYWGYFNEKGEQLAIEKYNTMALYIKDPEKRIPFKDGMNELMNTPVEVSLYMFTNEELDELKLPVVDAESLDRFYKNFGENE